MAADLVTFIKELPDRFDQIGALFPSSQMLAKSMVRPLRQKQGPNRILEVGPGTGPFTRAVLELMGPDDHFTVCEINPQFVETLKESLEDNEDYQRNKDRVEFFVGPVQDLVANGSKPEFDVIVSSLPMYNFPPELVGEILDQYEQMLKPNGYITFCEYLITRQVGMLFCNEKTRTRVKGVEEMVRKKCEEFASRSEFDKTVTVLNLPPALTYEFSYNGKLPPHSKAPE